MVEPDADRFWQFALDLYLPEEGRALFLRLQDDGGLDVPLALFCLWCGSEGVALFEAAMERAISFSTDWRRDRVEPLRALRRAWKGAHDSLPSALSDAARQRVAQAEQAVERLQMNHLVTLREGTRGDPDAAHANLSLYCRLAQHSPDEADLTLAVRLAVVGIAPDQGKL